MTNPAAPTRQFAQFAHLNTAALRPTRAKVGKDRKWTASQLLDEAARVPGASRHVRNPLVPVWLKGSRMEVEARAAAWRAQAREANGRARLRSTSPSLACAVVSWPRSREAQWRPYRDAVMAYFERSVGADRIAGAVEHLDEANQHIHVYFVPCDGESFGAVHQGIKARRHARKQPGNHVRTAFLAAMRTWQDELWKATGRPFGLERLGPKRRRLALKEFKDQKRAQELVENAQAEAEEVKRVATAEARELSRRAQADEDRAEKSLAQAERLGRKSTEMWNALRESESVFKATPPGEHQEALKARDAEIKVLRQRVAALENENDAARYRLRVHEARDAASSTSRTNSRGPTPPGLGK